MSTSEPHEAEGVPPSDTQPAPLSVSTLSSPPRGNGSTTDTNGNNNNRRLLADLLAALAPVYAMREQPQFIPTELIYRTPERDMAAFMRKNSKTFAAKERKAAASASNSKTKPQRSSGKKTTPLGGALHSPLNASMGQLAIGASATTSPSVKKTAALKASAANNVPKGGGRGAVPPPPSRVAAPSATNTSSGAASPPRSAGLLKDRTMTPMRASFVRTATATTPAPTTGGGGAPGKGFTTVAAGSSSPLGHGTSAGGPPRRAVSAMRNPTAHSSDVMRLKSPMRGAAAAAPTTHQPPTATAGRTGGGSALRNAASPGPSHRRSDPHAPRGFTTVGGGGAAAMTSPSEPAEAPRSASVQPQQQTAPIAPQQPPSGGGHGTGETPLSHTLQRPSSMVHHPSTSASVAAATAVDGNWDMQQRMEELLEFKTTNREALDRIHAHPDTYTRTRSFTAGAAGFNAHRSASQPAVSVSPMRERGATTLGSGSAGRASLAPPVAFSGVPHVAESGSDTPPSAAASMDPTGAYRRHPTSAPHNTSAGDDDGNPLGCTQNSVIMSDGDATLGSAIALGDTSSPTVRTSAAHGGADVPTFDDSTGGGSDSGHGSAPPLLTTLPPPPAHRVMIAADTDDAPRRSQFAEEF